VGDYRFCLFIGPSRAVYAHGARCGDYARLDGLLTGDVKGKRIGVPKEYVADGMSSEIKALWEKGADDLRAKGAEIVEISLPHTKYALPAYYIIAPAEASSNLARYDGVRYGHRAELGQGDGITVTCCRRAIMMPIIAARRKYGHSSSRILKTPSRMWMRS